MANILLEQAFKALEDVQDVEITAKDLYESKEEYNLPKEVTIDIHSLVDDDVDLSGDDYNLVEVISDWLSDEYGFCHFGFDYTYDYDKDPDFVYVTDIKWDTTESLDKYITEEDDLKESKHVCEKCGKKVCECDKKLNEESANTTTTISVLDDGEKVIKQVGYSALCKKLVNNKPVYTVKYAPGYVVNTIEAKHDREAISRFLGLNECLKESVEREYFVVSYGNPYKARIFNADEKEKALELAKSQNSHEDKEGEWKVYHYTQPVGGTLDYEIITEKVEEVAREEYCVLVNGNNEECYNSEEDAIKYARKRFAEKGNGSEVKVLLVKYGPKDEQGDEEELGFETVWASHFEESCKESKEECKDCDLAIKYWVDEEHRDQGLSDIYIGEIKDLDDAKHIADKLFDEYASVEVVKNVDTDHEEVLYGRYPEDESLKESKECFFEIVFKEKGDEEEKTERYEDDFDGARADFLHMTQDDKDNYQYVVLRKVCTDYKSDEDIEVIDSYGLNESLKEGLSKDEKSVSEEHKEDDKVVCAKCGSEEVKFNDSETKEPLCDKCYQKKVETQKEEEKKSLDESITVNINDEDEVKKAKKEIEKSEKKADEEEIIVDVDAETIDDLKDSYVGNCILSCTACKTLMYKKPELVEKDEETGLYNVGEACPHCGSESGFDLVGQVAKADVDVEEEDLSTTGAPVEQEEEKVEVKDEIKLPTEMKPEESNTKLEKLDLNEQRFDRLVNKFVHSTYENVENYETKNLYLDDNNMLIVEGVIKYKSGKEKEASFKLEEKKLSTTKEDVIALKGICEAFNTNEKAFTFRGVIKENKLNLNSLTYNFNINTLNESKNIKGKVCIKY